MSLTEGDAILNARRRQGLAENPRKKLWFVKYGKIAGTPLEKRTDARNYSWWLRITNHAVPLESLKDGPLTALNEAATGGEQREVGP